jgi:hypothetical protein
MLRPPSLTSIPFNPRTERSATKATGPDQTLLHHDHERRAAADQLGVAAEFF